MKRCPKCGKWSLSFDEHYERFRCLNRDCCWMASSAVERRMKRIRQHYASPELIGKYPVSDDQPEIKVFYDEPNDAMVCDFGSNEPSFELPEDDGRMIWRIGRSTGSVTGFILLEVRKYEVSKIKVKLVAKKLSIEESLKEIPGAVSQGRPSRFLVEKVEVLSREKMEKFENYDDTHIFAEALEKIKLKNGLASQGQTSK